ncbi:hypothetical protein COOONC_00370 [Cooperia oncophora]
MLQPTMRVVFLSTKSFHGSVIFPLFSGGILTLPNRKIDITIKFIFPADGHNTRSFEFLYERLVEKIKNNLYEDNLLLTADIVDEAARKYEQVIQMFRDLSMDVRLSLASPLLHGTATAEWSKNRHLKGFLHEQVQIAISIEVNTPPTKDRRKLSYIHLRPIGVDDTTYKTKVFIQSLVRVITRMKKGMDGLSGVHEGPPQRAPPRGHRPLRIHVL